MLSLVKPESTQCSPRGYGTSYWSTDNPPVAISLKESDSGPQQPSTADRSSTTGGTSGLLPVTLGLILCWLLCATAMSCPEAMVPIPPSRPAALPSFPPYPLSFGWKEVNIVDSSTAEHSRSFLSDFDEFWVSVVATSHRQESPRESNRLAEEQCFFW